MDNNSYMVIVDLVGNCYDFYIVATETEEKAEELATLKYKSLEGVGSGVGNGIVFDPDNLPAVNFDESGVSQLFTFYFGD